MAVSGPVVLILRTFHFSHLHSSDEQCIICRSPSAPSASFLASKSLTSIDVIRRCGLLGLTCVANTYLLSYIRVMVHLTIADIIVLKNLDRDIEDYTEKSADQTTPSDTEDEIDRQLQRDTTANQVTLEDEKTVQLLDDLTKKPTIFTAWDEYQLPKPLRQYIIHPYIDWANTIVRRPADIVFLTHILFYTATLIPSTVLLFRHFTYLHGILHLIFEVWCAGAWTLLLHNHIHNNGVLQKHLAWVDKTFPYVLGPLMGHTWNSYYWHHVKHHHVENNGPGDLSSTIRYQRDSVWHFIQYELRFLTLTWLELPLYFYRKGQYKYAARCATAEWSSLILLWTALWWNARPALFTLVLPLCIMRFGMMVGNWGQHCLVDEVDPDSDFRSSITLIDEAVCVQCLFMMTPN